MYTETCDYILTYLWCHHQAATIALYARSLVDCFGALLRLWNILYYNKIYGKGLIASTVANYRTALSVPLRTALNLDLDPACLR